MDPVQANPSMTDDEVVRWCWNQFNRQVHLQPSLHRIKQDVSRGFKALHHRFRLEPEVGGPYLDPWTQLLMRTSGSHDLQSMARCHR